MPRPWEAKADELHATEGPYCDFAAWEEWADDLLQLDLDNAIDRVTLYAAMCDLCDQSATPAASEERR